MGRMATLLIATLVVLLILASCGNDTPVNCPQEGYGTLQGVVRSSGQGIAVEVAVLAEEDDYYGVSVFSTMSDSSGWYSLDLPTGVYRLEVRPDEIFSNSLKSPDTIRITPRVIPFDLERCRAEVILQMPPEFDGRSFTLELEDDDGSVRSRARQEDGLLRFEYPAIIPGYFTMEIQNSRLGRPLKIRRPTAPVYDAHLWVDATDVARFDLDYRQVQASISGTVSGACVESGSRPRMTAYSADSVSVGEVYCDLGGTYKLITLNPQPVRLASKYSGDVSWWIGGDSYAEATVFDLAPMDEVTGVDIEVAGFQLVLEGPGNFISHELYVLLLDEAGRTVTESQYYGNPVSICSLRPGRYFLKVDGYCQQQTWAPQWYSGATMQGDAVPIVLEAGEFRQLEMQLVTAGRISGEMRAADGSLAPIDNLGLFDAEGDDLCNDYRNFRDFQDGRFTFGGLADGPYFMGLKQWSNGYSVWWYPGTWEFSEATPLVIEGGAEVSGLTWPMPPTEGGIRE